MEPEGMKFRPTPGSLSTRSGEPPRRPVAAPPPLGPRALQLSASLPARLSQRGPWMAPERSPLAHTASWDPPPRDLIRLSPAQNLVPAPRYPEDSLQNPRGSPRGRLRPLPPSLILRPPGPSLSAGALPHLASATQTPCPPFLSLGGPLGGQLLIFVASDEVALPRGDLPVPAPGLDLP